MVIQEYFFLFSHMFLQGLEMSFNNICFYQELEKITLELSPNISC